MRLTILLVSPVAFLLAPLAAAPASAAPPGTERQDTHWAFQPVRRPELPVSSGAAGSSSPVDLFIMQKLRDAGIKPAEGADGRTLVRRLYLDLIGLPPTPAEIEAVLSDRSPDAVARVVDDLLARPEYGERWARHWLDLVRYAETNGYERDGAKPHAWRYRDYVIDAFNRDKPFDRFLTEQLAGDEVEGSDATAQIATTFLRLGTWDDEPAEPVVDRYDQLDDVLGTTATAFLGITLRCARCHDHKFEPFSQVDYYRMLAVFEPLKRPQEGRKELDRAVGTEAELAAYHAATLKRAPPPALLRAYVWFEDGPNAPATHVFKRGDPTRPGAAVVPGVPAVLAAQQPEPPQPAAQTTGRRLWLARWLTSPKNPLVARVIVNRIWQYHFGQGLVASSSDFGVMGDAPSHPELLDWLASELIASGWRLKPLHRLIVLSQTYQRSSNFNPESAHVDPGNALLWRWRARRLEAEVVRDMVLAVSGQLNPRMGGPSFYPTLPREVLEGQSRPGEGWGKSDDREQSRRSIYIFAKRSLAVPELELLDTPDSTSSCERRMASTTGPQALTFLNGKFVHQQAEHLAARLRSLAAPGSRDQLERAFMLTVGRPPRPEEAGAAVAFLDRQARQIEQEAAHAAVGRGTVDYRTRALESFCLVLLNMNDFVYIK